MSRSTPGPNRRDVAGRRDGARSNNRDRILEASLDLFNERGFSAVSTNAIAGFLGISPGNLYYHFANKEQIVRELWSSAATMRLFELPDDGSLLPAEALASRFIEAIDAISRFRFLARDLDEILARDDELATGFRAEVETSCRQLVALFESLVAHGVMKAPRKDRDLERLGVNVVILLLNWIRFLSTARATMTPKGSDLAEGSLQAFLMLEPYLDPKYAARARGLLERHIEDPEADPKRASRA